MTTGNTDEQSVMDSVFSKGSDMGADSAAPGASEPASPAPEVTALEPKPDQVVTAEQVSDDDAPLQGRDTKSGRFVPVTELVNERKKLKAERDTEVRLRMEAEANAKAYREQVEHYQRQYAQPQRAAQPEQQAQPVPDPVLEPEEYAQYQNDLIDQKFVDQRVQVSHMLAKAKHGEAVVNEAFEAARKANIAHRFQYVSDPFEALLDWHRRVKVQTEIGDDFEGFKKKIEDQATQKALANLKAGGQPAGQAQDAQRFPTSLADQTATGSQGAAISEATAINGVFDREQRRRA